MAYETIDSLYRHLSPQGLSPSSAPGAGADTKPQTLQEVLTNCFLDHRSIFLGFETIKAKIDAYNTQPNKTASDKNLIGQYYHIIGNSPLGRVDFSDAGYWGKVNSIEDIVPSLKTLKNTDMKSSVFVTRDPYVNPSIRGSQHVDFFLNYTPPIAAAQMMPYLEVEFQIDKPLNNTDEYLSTPSILRFLMGSSKLNSLAPKDQAMALAAYQPKDSFAGIFSNSGMELFLMPQTLTNMDDIRDLSVRLVRPKPFVPFASIEGLDIQISNAGALTYATKKGTLKLKVHDKSRISELAEFIKGPRGFAQALIWTTYGWIAPMNRGDEDEYSKFINDNMIVRDCWSVINSQFSIDATGQVSITLEMMSKAAKVLQEINVADGDPEIAGLKQMKIAMEEIANLKNKYAGDARFTVDIQAEQVLNAASTTGMFTDLKDVNIEQAIKNMVSSLRKGGIPKEDVESLEKNIKKLKSDYSYENVKNSVASAVKRKFDALANTPENPDPFLASESNKDFFKSLDLISKINEYKAASEERNKVAQGKKSSGEDKKSAGVIKLDSRADVVSFGKLFMNFVIPSVQNSLKCQELQVCFYGLNDQCGPVSGLSIAEFPIDVQALAYAYAEAIRLSNSDVLPLDAFIKLVIETQFSDVRAIGYGMNRFYKPRDRDKPSEAEFPEDKKEKAAAMDGMSKWIMKYGSLKMPQLELYVETADEGSTPTNIIKNLKKSFVNYERDGKAPRVIKRIHVYDKTHTPHKFAQQVLDNGRGDFVVGDVDMGLLEAKEDALFKKLQENTKNNMKELLKKIQDDPGNYASVLKSAAGGDPGLQSEVDQLSELRSPGKKEVIIPKDRVNLKAHLKRIVPNITIGTNGTMVQTANLASKTDGLQGTLNYMSSLKGTKEGKATISDNGLEELGGLPLRTVPVQLTLATAGVPIAQLYQQYFIDFDTGTTLDNLYTCNQLTHSISKGKFVTNWTFSYANGYGKFTGPPTETELVSGQIGDRLQKFLGVVEPPKPPNKPASTKKATKPAEPAKK